MFSKWYALVHHSVSSLPQSTTFQDQAVTPSSPSPLLNQPALDVNAFLIYFTDSTPFPFSSSTLNTKYKSSQKYEKMRKKK